MLGTFLKEGVIVVVVAARVEQAFLRDSDRVALVFFSFL